MNTTTEDATLRYEELYEGIPIFFTLHGTKHEGAIALKESIHDYCTCYICSDVLEGATAPNKHGYRCSYVLQEMSRETMTWALARYGVRAREPRGRNL